MSDTLGDPIAVLVDGRHVVCLACYNKKYGTHATVSNLYRVNVAPYEQGCHDCNQPIIEYLNKGWVELFNREGCKNCLCCLCGLQSPIDATVHKGCSDYEMATIEAEHIHDRIEDR